MDSRPFSLVVGFSDGVGVLQRSSTGYILHFTLALVGTWMGLGSLGYTHLFH
jgi:hypothetical protein